MKAKFYINLTTEPIVESNALLSTNLAENDSTLIGTVTFGRWFKGDRGDAFTYADFTPEQLEALKVKGDRGDQGEKGEQGIQGDQGEQGAKGKPFEYADFTVGQLEALMVKGDKGDKGEQGEKGDKGDKGEQGNVSINIIPYAVTNLTLNSTSAQILKAVGSLEQWNAIIDGVLNKNTSIIALSDSDSTFIVSLVAISAYRSEYGETILHLTFFKESTNAYVSMAINCTENSFTCGRDDKPIALISDVNDAIKTAILDSWGGRY